MDDGREGPWDLKMVSFPNNKEQIARCKAVARSESSTGIMHVFKCQDHSLVWMPVVFNGRDTLALCEVIDVISDTECDVVVLMVSAECLDVRHISGEAPTQPPGNARFH